MTTSKRGNLKRKCSVCHDLYETKKTDRQICDKRNCRNKRLSNIRKGIFIYTCTCCNKVFKAKVKLDRADFYCSAECKESFKPSNKPTPKTKYKAGQLEIDYTLDFPEQPLIQQTYNKMLAAKEPLSADTDYLISKLLELYPEDSVTLHKIAYSKPLHAVFKISAYYGTPL